MSFDTGLSETMFTVPVTRGSRMKLRPVCWPTVLITDWMSAFTKLTVILSSVAAAAAGDGACACAGAMSTIPAAKTDEASQGPASDARNLVTIWGFGFDLLAQFCA